MVVLQHSTKPFSTFDLSGNGTDIVARINQSVAESLMISLGVVMLDVPMNGILK